MKQVGIFTVRNEVAKVMFLHESVCPQVGMPGQVHPPGPDTPAGPGAPSRTRYTSTGPGTPWDQVPPSGPGTRPRTRYPQNQVPPGAGTHPSGARYPPDQVHPLGPCAPPPETDTVADGTHPTGMHSCSENVFAALFVKENFNSNFQPNWGFCQFTLINLSN